MFTLLPSISFLPPFFYPNRDQNTAAIFSFLGRRVSFFLAQISLRGQLSFLWSSGMIAQSDTIHSWQASKQLTSFVRKLSYELAYSRISVYFGIHFTTGCGHNFWSVLMFNIVRVQNLQGNYYTNLKFDLIIKMRAVSLK